jgi:acetoin utilization deacetylase AcuC-like enzyme
MRVGWVCHDDFLLHDTREDHPERPERLTRIREGLAERGLLGQLIPIPFDTASPQALAMIHDPAYIDLVRMACESGFTFIGSYDNPICPRSYEVARLAVGGVVAACDAVMAGTVDRAFCAVRPPGHHAETDQAMGFCLFNNVAIAAEHLVRSHKLTRVAIVDLDVHHGNGTQHAFESRGDVLFISLHERGIYPGTGHESEAGIGPGEGFTLNIPLLGGSDEKTYRRAIENQVLPRLDDFRPQFIVLSMGFDTYREERIAHMNLEADSFGPLTRLLAEAANSHCRGRLVSVLEGGYWQSALGRCAAAHVAAMM